MSLEKRFNYLMILFLLLLLAGIYYYTRPPSEDLLEAQDFFMDTFVTIRMKAPKDYEILYLLLEEMRSLEKTLSRHVEGSDIYNLNEKAGISPVVVEDKTMELLLLAKEYGDITKGSFDITIAPLLSLWGFGEEEQRVPEEEEILSLLPLVDYSLLVLDRDQMTAFLPIRGMAVDLGGIAKGFIVDEGIRFIREQGIEQALISAGGDISVIGGRPGGGPWRIGIRDPKGSPDEHLGLILRIHDGSVDTSGSYERFFEEEGKQYHHILDPKTGYPAFGLLSTTVVCQSSAIADILSTALFVMGVKEGERLINSLPETEALIITQGNHQWMSPGFMELTKE